MLDKVIFASNALDPLTYVQHADVTDVLGLIKETFPVLPADCKFYHNEVSLTTDVTPCDEKTIHDLTQLDGTLYVIVYPAFTEAIIATILINLAIAAVSFAISYFLAPDTTASAVSTTTATETEEVAETISTASPNNIVGSLSNTARPKARIPDIYGTVKSIPDLIMKEYFTYENNLKVAWNYLCVGRGAYDITEENIFNDDSILYNIPGVSLEVYPPYSTPIASSGTPQLTIGSSLYNVPLEDVRTSSLVDNLEITPVPDGNLTGLTDLQLIPSSRITSDTALFSDNFKAGDEIVFTTPDKTIPFYLDIAAFNVYAYGGVIGGDGIPPSVYPAQIGIDGDHAADLLTGDDVVISGSGSFTYEGVDYNLNGTFEILDTFIFSAPNVPLRTLLVLDVPASGDWNDFENALLYNNAFGVDAVGNEGISVPSNAGDTFNLSGSYKILNVSNTEMILDNPSKTNSAWSTFESYSPASSSIVSTGDGWSSPYILEQKNMDKIIFNVTAPNGLYRKSTVAEDILSIQFKIELTIVDSDGNQLSPPEEYLHVLKGTSATATKVAKTIVVPKQNLADSKINYVKIRIKRHTAYYAATGGDINETLSQTIYLEQLLHSSSFGRWIYIPEKGNTLHAEFTDFGDVTTIRTKTIASSSEGAIGDGTLNLVVTRKLPARIGQTSEFTEDLFATESAADIICAICLDKKIGNRSISEIDVSNIYSAIAEIDEYFDNNNCSKFSFTFDSLDLSFEETLAIIGAAIFCTVSRLGNKIKLFFEKKTDKSSLLFNHRNKIPKSEKRVVTFGTENNRDGVELSWVDPDSSEEQIIYVPSNQSAEYPKSITSVGIRNLDQANILAHRTWNKLQFQNTRVEFKCTQEASPLVVGERILVADNTRASTIDGEVISQNIMELTLSQDVEFVDGVDYTMFLQHIDGTVQSVEVTAGGNMNQVILAEPPTVLLALNNDLYQKTTYVIVESVSDKANAFIVVEKIQHDNFTFTIKAVGYSDKYYQQDDGATL